MEERHDIQLASAPNGTRGSIGRNIIAVIGIDRYRRWPRLANAVCDATGTAAMFRRLGFEQVTSPLLDDDATGKAIQSLVTDDLTTLDPNDSLVLFYAGHGATRKHRFGDQVFKTGHLIPVDASASPDKVSTWIDLEGWLRAVSLLPAKHILVVLDACHSGVALDPLIKWRDISSWNDTPLSTLNARRSRRIITSALDDQVALDSGPVYGHSLFTGCLIEGLTQGIRPNGPRVITGSELAMYVQRRVERYPASQQTPDFGTFAFDERGEMLIPLAIAGLEAFEANSNTEPRSNNDSSDVPPKAGALAPDRALGVGGPLRRTLLFGAATAGASTLIGVNWIIRRLVSSPPSWKNERHRLEDAIHLLSSNLGSEQDPHGGFSSIAYTPARPNAYDTAQELTGLIGSVRTSSGVFDLERRDRGFKALEQMANDWKDGPSDISMKKWNLDYISGKKPEPSRTVGVAWAIIAASRYVQLQGDAEARKLAVRLRSIIMERQLDNGSFEHACEPINHGYANAYATTMATWALCEAEQVESSTELMKFARRRGAAWLTHGYLSPPQTEATAIASVRGLAEQAFWVTERSRDIDAQRYRSNLQDTVAEMVTKQLLKDCASSDESLCFNSNGKIPNGRETDERYTMLWLPWATLAVIDIANCPARSSGSSNSNIESLMRRLILTLASQGTMAVSHDRFAPAEHLFAMSEALERLPVSDV